MIADQDLYRISSWASWVALVALVIAAVTITLFFAGAGAFWGPVNDVFDTVLLVALVFPVLAIDRLAGPAAQPWLKIVTVAAIAGLIMAAAGEALLVMGVIDLETSYVTGGVGIIPFLAWLIALAIIALGRGILPPSIGWLAVGFFVLSVAVVFVSALTLGPPLWIAAVALLLVMGGLFAALATTMASTADRLVTG